MADRERFVDRLVSRLLGTGVAVSGLLLAAGLFTAAPMGERLLHWGIVLLIATPVSRVVLLAGAFAAQKEWRMFWASAGVLGLLAAGALTGAGH